MIDTVLLVLVFLALCYCAHYLQQIARNTSELRYIARGDEARFGKFLG